jgi:hypothetical protein
LSDGETEVSLLLPRRSYGKAWRRVLHDQTADRIVDIVSQLPHVNATIVPFHVSPGLKESTLLVETALHGAKPPEVESRALHENLSDGSDTTDVRPIAALHWRSRAKVVGRVKSMRVQPMGEVPNLECVLIDNSGEAITLVFLGRRSIGGLHSGSVLRAEGMVGKHRGRLAMINPSLELQSPSTSEAES